MVPDRSLFKKNGRAFTLIEILLVVVIIGIMATIALPRLVRRKPSSGWMHVQQELNNMILFARQEAISHQKIYRITFVSQNEEPDIIKVEREEDDPGRSGAKLFVPVYSEYFQSKYELPSIISLVGVFHGKVEKLQASNSKFLINYLRSLSCRTYWARKFSTAEANASGCWYMTPWPPPSNVTNWAPGISWTMV